MMVALEQHSAVDSVYKQIQNMMRDGILLPGDQLRETEFAAQFGVSRNTLREAFRMLAREHLVHHEPHKGVSVSRPTLSDAIDIYRVRRLVEVTAIHNAAPSHPASRIMEDAVAATREAVSRNDWRHVGSANARFHIAIIALADSHILNNLAEVLYARLQLVLNVIGSPLHIYARYVEDNAAIMNTYQQGNGAAAANMLHKYLERSEAQITSAYIMNADDTASA